MNRRHVVVSVAGGIALYVVLGVPVLGPFRTALFVPPIPVPEAPQREPPRLRESKAAPTLYHAPTVESGTEGEFFVVAFTGGEPMEPDPVRYDRIIEATGNPLFVDGHPIRFMSSGVIHAGTPVDRPNRRDYDARWDPEGKPMEDLTAVPWHGGGPSSTVMLLALEFQFDRRLHATPTTPELHFDSGVWHGSNSRGFQNRDISSATEAFSFLYWPDYPVADDILLNFDLYYGEPDRFPLPLESGATIRMKDNVFVLGMVKGGEVQANDYWRNNRNEIIVASQPGRPYTYFGGYLVDHSEPKRFTLEVELQDGRVLRNRLYNRSKPVQILSFMVAPEEIRSATLLRSPYVAHVTFPLGPHPALPAVNRGVRNVLDLTYPTLHLPDTKTVHEFVGRVLGSWFDRNVNPQRDPGPQYLEDVTVREVLEMYYPEEWPIKQ